MPVDSRVSEALRFDHLKLPPVPRVLSIEAEDYVTYDGEDALRIWITIPEDTTDEELRNGRAFLELDQRIHDSLLAKGITLFPYTTVTKPSERFISDDEE